MDQELLDAIKSNRLDEVHRLVRERPELVRVPYFLHIVFFRSRPSLACLELLFAAGADVMEIGWEGETPIHISVGAFKRIVHSWSASHEEVIELFRKSGVDILKALTAYGWTPMMEATIEGTPESMAALLAVGADPNQAYPPGECAADTTLLWQAVYEPKKLRLLLEAGADLAWAIEHGQSPVELAEFLLKNYPAWTPVSAREREKGEILESLEILKRAEAEQSQR